MMSEVLCEDPCEDPCDDPCNDFSEEIDQLISRCHQLRDNMDTSFEKLQHIKNLINMNVSYNGNIMDFNDLLTSFHTISIENIKKTGKNNFGEQILHALDSLLFL